MRPIDFCHPTLYERAPVLACSRIIVRTCALRIPERLRLSGPRNRAFHDAQNASADRLVSWGVFVPTLVCTNTKFRNWLWRSTSDTPVASLARSTRGICRDAIRWGPPRPFPPRVPWRARRFRDPRCLPSISNSRLRMPFTGHRSWIVVGLATLHIALPTVGFSSLTAFPRSACRRCEASSGERYARVAGVRSREDCHPWARPPFTRFPFWRWEAASLGRRRLPTSADQIRRTGTPSSAIIPARIRSVNPSRGFVSPAFAWWPPLSSRAIRSEPNEFWRRRKPSSHRRGRSQEPIRADRAEWRTRALRELPSSHPCRAPRRRQPVAAKDLECPPPRLTPPLLLRDRDVWLACWSRSSFPRPPAKENVFPKTGVPSTVSSSFWVRGDRSSRPLGLGLLVTPPCLGPRFARSRQVSLLQSGIAIGEYQRLWFHPARA